MSHRAPRLDAAHLGDELGQRPHVSTERLFRGPVFAVDRDRVDLPGQGTVTRDCIRHPGAVTVLALRAAPGGGDELLAIRQYRHALGVTEWELPAGLLDVAGEPPWETAARELAEEADLRARTWHVLAGYASSPGASDEVVRIFLARDLGAVPEAARHVRRDEEAGIEFAWLDLDAAYDAVLAGRFANPGLCIGVLAAHAGRARDWATLRPADAPWPEHPAYRAT